jgi:hypothetical protein
MEAAVVERIAQRRREYDALDQTIRARVPFSRWLAFNSRQRRAVRRGGDPGEGCELPSKRSPFSTAPEADCSLLASPAKRPSTPAATAGTSLTPAKRRDLTADTIPGAATAAPSDPAFVLGPLSFEDSITEAERRRLTTSVAHRVGLWRSRNTRDESSAPPDVRCYLPCPALLRLRYESG